MHTQSPALLASLVDMLLDAVCVVDKTGHFVFVSAACEQIFGYKPDEMIGKAMIDMVAPDDRERTLASASDIMAGHARVGFENRYVRKDGSLVHIMWSARWSEEDQLRIAVARDITGRKRAESLQVALYAISEAAHAAEDLLTLFCLIHQIIERLLPAHQFSVALVGEKTGLLHFPYHADARGPIDTPHTLAAQNLFAQVVESGVPLLLGADLLAPLAEIAPPDAEKPLLCWIGVPLNSHKGIIGALALLNYAGGVHYTERDQELLQFVSTQVATAIEHKQMQARLQRMAQYDELTNLPNRGLLHDRLDMALARARREGGRMSLLYVDLDHFKQVNDTFGHAVGDLLLQEVAERLKRCVRATDTVARMGGDEFVVLLEHVNHTDHAERVAAKIREALNQTIVLEEHALNVQVSIGVAHYPEQGSEVRHLIRCADEAMYVEKHRR